MRTPVIYPVSEIPEKYHYINDVEPLAFMYESYREISFGALNRCNLNLHYPLILVTIIFFSGLVLSTKRRELTWISCEVNILFKLINYPKSIAWEFRAYVFIED